MKKQTVTIEVFRAKNGEWGYRALHKNGKELFRASETYKRRVTMLNGLFNLVNAIHDGNYQVNE